MPFTFNPITGSLDSVQDISNLTTGPASTTDNTVPRFDGTTGKLLQSSSVTITDDGRLQLGTDGTGSLDAVTKQQLDAAIGGVDVKEGVRAASTANLTLSGEQTIDGIALVTGDRILVKNQTSVPENGIYIIASGAWTRASDSDTADELNGALVTVKEGSTNANTGWYQNNEITTIGSDNIVFEQFFGAGTYSADGNGIELSGSTFSLELDGSTLSKSASGLKVADLGIDSGQIAANAVTTTKILDSNVTTPKIADLNVTTPKIADANVTTAKIADANVTTDKIANDAVTTDKILDSNVTTAKIADGSITSDKLADGVLNTKTTTSKTTTYTATTSDNVIYADASGGDFAITLYSASGNTGKQLIIKNIGASGTVTIDGDGSETIDGKATILLDAQYDTVTLISNGTNWTIIDQKAHKKHEATLTTNQTQTSDDTWLDLTASSVTISPGTYDLTYSIPLTLGNSSGSTLLGNGNITIFDQDDNQISNAISLLRSSVPGSSEIGATMTRTLFGVVFNAETTLNLAMRKSTTSSINTRVADFTGTLTDPDTSGFFQARKIGF